MFKNGFKFGFGLAIGYVVGIAVLDITTKQMSKAVKAAKEES